MSRVAFVFAVIAVAAMVTPAAADESAVSSSGLPIAPNGGKASIHQWGAIDDAFAVNPDGESAPAKSAHSLSPTAQGQDAPDSNDPGDPDPDHFGEILAI